MNLYGRLRRGIVSRGAGSWREVRPKFGSSGRDVGSFGKVRSRPFVDLDAANSRNRFKRDSKKILFVRLEQAVNTYFESDSDL